MRRLPHRSSQLLSVILIVIFCTLLFYINANHKHGKYRIKEQESNQQSKFGSEILPTKQISSDNESLLIPLPSDPMKSLFISVKTSEKFLVDRVEVILKTWYNLARDAIYFFTDSTNRHFEAKTNGHMINTNCSASHNRRALCCKMGVELDTFVRMSGKKWFCHFDDDNYVNVPKLLELVSGYDSKDDWYLGKPSIKVPLQIVNRNNGSKIGFWFATGGAGFCLSRSLVLKMMPFTRLVCDWNVLRNLSLKLYQSNLIQWRKVHDSRR